MEKTGKHQCAPSQFNSIKTDKLHHIVNLMHNPPMRTTITLDDETHGFVSYYARARGISLGEAIGELIRKAQAAPHPAPEILRAPNGLPMFPPTGRTITAEMVKKLEEEEFDPKNFT